MAQNEKPNENAAPPQDENQIIAERRAKLAELLRDDAQPFEYEYDVFVSSAPAFRKYLLTTISVAS